MIVTTLKNYVLLFNNCRNSSLEDMTSTSSSLSDEYCQRKYPETMLEHGENVWSKLDPDKLYYIRNQSRFDLDKQVLTELDIQLDSLKNHFSQSSNGATYWFHAISWSSAIKKINNGPQFSTDLLDFTFAGAYYLNPKFDDCYQWLYTKNSKFKGRHAILIYQFNPWVLSEKGEQLDVKTWKQTVRKRTLRQRKHGFD